MKRIINGKIYNTKTAKEVENWTNGLPCSDFGYVWETLYKTGKGNYFLAGEGGPMSIYSESHGNDVCGSSHITPMSLGEVQGWMESRKISNDDLEKELTAAGLVEEA